MWRERSVLRRELSSPHTWSISSPEATWNGMPIEDLALGDCIISILHRLVATFLSLFLGGQGGLYWGLNSGPQACETGALPLEPLYQWWLLLMAPKTLEMRIISLSL
jgi:hypothetical protein